jgi:selenoprotein W-related protein
VAANILQKRPFEYFIDDFRLVVSDGGRFEFEVNGDLLYSKKQLGRHAEQGEVEGLFRDYLEKYLSEKGIPIPDFDAEEA